MTTDPKRRFEARYDAEDIPWDTGITPPEIMQIVAELCAGKALDLGCGTGTNVRYLLEKGWQADGVDFVPRAIEVARQKLADFPQARYGLYCHDVSKLHTITDWRAPYDLVLDIGCGHSIPVDEAGAYARDVAALMKPGAIWMLYAHQPDAERDFGWTPDDVRRIFSADFEIASQQLSDDTSSGMPSGWYRLVKRAAL